MKLSVIIPAYNERATIEEVLNRVQAVELDLEREIIVVDDGSTDGTRQVLESLASRNRIQDQKKAAVEIKAIFHERNQGKGAAVRSGLREATGDIVVIQDADLEYDPAEFPKLLQPIIDNVADVVYGSRFTGHPRRVLYFWHSLGNKFLTLVCNICTDLNLTDMETGYKVFRSQVIKSIRICSNGFGFEPEVTAKVARRGCRIYEVPIAYRGRTYDEGKKAHWKNGLGALWAIVRFSLVDDRDNSDPAYSTLLRVRRLSRYNRWLWRMIEPYVGDRVLEIGAGVGTFTCYLATRSRLIATDVDPAYLMLLRNQFGHLPNVAVQFLDLSNPSLNGRGEPPPDTILCLNVLEHVENDLQSLRGLYSLLSPGGRLALLVPAHQCLYGTIDRSIGHYRRYGRVELVEKLTQAGFQVEKLRFLNMLGAVGWYVNGRLLRRKTVPPFQAMFNSWLTPLVELEERLSLPVGLSILAVGVK